MSRSRQLSAYLAVFCLMLAACGGDDEDSRPQPTTTAPSTTQSQEQQDEQALRQLAEDWFAAAPAIFGSDPQPNDPGRYLVNPYLGQVRAQVDDYRTRGVEVRRDERSDHEIETIEVDGTSATIVECLVDGDILVESDTGEVLDDGVAAFRTSTTALLADGEWRLSERTTVGSFEGEDKCSA